MSSLFAGLKEKFADKLAEFKGSATPVDPADKHAHDIVEAATSDELIAPDWSLNFNVIDFVNSDVRHNTGRTLKAIKRSLAKPNTKVQLLSLTLLESCVKNCPVEFHGQLATSELWADVVKLAEDTSITRVDAEVRDKVLGMVEDFSRLQPGQFQATYGSLLDRGVDFPIRAPNEAVPLLTPPAHAAAAGAPPAIAAPVAAVATAGGDVPAAAAAAAPAEGAAAAEADPLAGVDEQDRAAIQAALAELEAEAQAAQEAARIAAEADAEERRQQLLLQQQQQAAAQLMMQQQQQQQQQAAMEAEAALGLLAAAQTAEAAAAAQAATATATATATGAATATATAGDLSIGGPVPATHEQQQQPHPADSGGLGVQPQQQAEAEAGERPEPVGERVANLLETANNTTLLLSEMLASVPDSEPLAVREPYVAEVADTCVRLRRKLERDLVTLSDEALLASALSQHEELSRVLMRYDELLAAAEAVAPTVPRNAAAVALSHAAASRGPAVAGGVAPHGHPHPPPLQHPQQPGELYYGQAPAAGTETAGQKVAAVAAALKERFAGAFDKLMAAAAAARAPGALPPSTAAPVAGAATAIGSMGPADIGGVTRAGTGAGGAFTLLDDDDEEANEGTALITKRAMQPDAAAAASLQPQLQLQQMLHQATAAAVQPPLPPPAAAAGPDLINFDDEAQAPAAAEPVLPVSEQEQQQQPETAEPTVAIQVSQSGATSAAAGGLDDLLSGLTVHATTDSAAAGAEASPPPPPPVETVIRDGSGSDQLVEALDRLVSQSSVSASPVEAARPAVAEPLAAPQLQEPKEPLLEPQQ